MQEVQEPSAPTGTFLPEVPPYWLRFAGHLVRFGTLDHPVRAMAQVATLVGLIALLVLTLPLGSLPAVQALTTLVAIHMPWIILIVGATLQAAGWWYLLTGASMTGAAMRWPVTLAFLVFLGLAVPGNLPVAVPLLLAVAYLAYTNFRRLPERLNLVAMGVLVVLSYALVLRGGSVAFALTLLNQVMFFYLLFVPVIFYSGFDLGETGLHFARLGLLRLHPHLGANALWWAALGVAAAKLLILALTWHRLDLGVLPALAVIAVGAMLTRWLAPAEEEPPELLPFAFSLLIFAAVFGSAGMALSWSWSALACLVVGASLAAFARRRPALATSAVFLLVFGLWNVFNSMTFGPGNPAWSLLHGLPPIDARGLNEAVTLSALGYLVWLRVRQRLTAERALLAIFWMIGLSLVLGTWNLLEWLQSLSRGFLPAEAVLLVIGIAHEVAASGGMLNRGSPRLPRPARVLLYLGYLLLLCGSTVLANGTSGPTADLINIDTFQQGGLILIGMPLFLQQFLHVFAFGHRGEHHHGHEGAAEAGSL